MLFLLEVGKRLGDFCEIKGKKNLGKTSNPNTCLFEYRHVGHDLGVKRGSKTKRKELGNNCRFQISSTFF